MKFRITVLLFFLSSILCAQKYTVSGYVKDAGSGEVLIGATVVDKNQPSIGVATNIYGYYSFELPKGEYTLKASYIGFATKEVAINLQENVTMNFGLKEEASSLEEVVVSATRSDENVSSVKMSTEKLQIERIKSMPALFGEVDVVKVYNFFPEFLLQEKELQVCL